MKGQSLVARGVEYDDGSQCDLLVPFDDLPIAIEQREAEGASPGVPQHLDRLAERVAELGRMLQEPSTAGSQFTQSVAAVDALDRIASMATALAREATVAAFDSAEAHLSEDDASPGAQRMHIGQQAGRPVDAGDRYLDRHELVAAAIGPVLRAGRRDAQRRVYEATEISRLMPHVHERQLVGDWTGWHIRVFRDALAHVSDKITAEADERIAGVPGRIGIGVLRARVERFLRIRNIPARGQGADEGPQARSVRVGPTDLFGMANLHAYLPAPQAKGIDQLLNDLAAQASHDDPRTLCQRRADAFMACFTGPAALNPEIAGRLGYEAATPIDPRFCGTAVDPQQRELAGETWESLRVLGATLGLQFAQAPLTEINVHIPATTLMDLRAAADGKHADGVGGLQELPRDVIGVRGYGALPRGAPTRDGPAPPDNDEYQRYRAEHCASFEPFIEGYGPITEEQIAAMMRDAVWRRVITEPETGAPLDVGTSRYRPPAAMRRRVQLRDGQCRFPDCGAAAATVDLDHVREHASGGRTGDWNLLSLCRHHHRVKHQTPWRPVMHDDGTVTWRNALLDLTITTEPREAAGETDATVNPTGV